MLTQERLKELFHYEPETGLFTRLKSGSGRTNYIGSIAGSLTPKGYIRIQIGNNDYYAQRLAWLYMTGRFPEKDTDHINGIRNDNRWLNLRECNQSQNQQNRRKAQKNNKSTGLLGASASWNKNGTYVAKIKLNEKQKYLGTFKTAELAHQAYLEEKRRIHEFNTL